MKLPGSLGELFAQAQQLQQNFSQMQEEMAKKRYEGSAGGGMVTAVVDGALHVISVRIEPALISASEQSMLQDLITAAMNDALHKAKESAKSDFSKMTGGISFPGAG